MSERNLTTKDILQKEFKPALRGFNTADVDEFLDLIIRDYESYEKEVAYLTSELDRLKRQSSATENSRSDRSKIKTGPASTGTTNYDILKRLSKLEKEVFGVQAKQAIAEEKNDTGLSRSETSAVPAVEENDDTIVFKNN